MYDVAVCKCYTIITRTFIVTAGINDCIDFMEIHWCIR